jgi:hypothetical protein
MDLLVTGTDDDDDDDDDDDVISIEVSPPSSL